MKCRLTAFSEVASRVPTYWMDRPLGYVLVLLQDHADQVSKFAGCCRAALAMMHEELFPLDPTPQGLVPLMQKFPHGEAIHEFVLEQMVGGAKVALAFVRVHHPHIDLQVVGRGLPLPPDGGMVGMKVHYAAAAAPAENIIRLVEAETDNILWQRRGQ